MKLFEILSVLNELRMNTASFSSVNVDNYLMGFEFEFLVSAKKYNRYYHEIADDLAKKFNKTVTVERTYGRMDFDYTNSDVWYIMDDASVSGDGCFALELVTSAEPIQDALKTLTNILKYIRDHGQTNETCGLHINISFKDKAKTQHIDPLKVALFLGTTHLYKLFRSTIPIDFVKNDEKNNYTKPNIHILKRKLYRERGNKLDDILNSRFIKEWVSKITEILMKQPDWGDRNMDPKYQVVNLSKLASRGYLEFRVTGGKNYEFRFDDVILAIKRYLYIMEIATTDLYSDEYIKKLYKVIGEVLDTYITYDDDDNMSSQKISDLSPMALKFYNRFQPYIKNDKSFGYGMIYLIKAINSRDKSEVCWQLTNIIFELFKEENNTVFNPRVQAIFKHIAKLFNITKDDVLNAKLFFEEDLLGSFFDDVETENEEKSKKEKLTYDEINDEAERRYAKYRYEKLMKVAGYIK